MQLLRGQLEPSIKSVEALLEQLRRKHDDLGEAKAVVDELEVEPQVVARKQDATGHRHRQVPVELHHRKDKRREHEGADAVQSAPILDLNILTRHADVRSSITPARDPKQAIC